MEQGWIKVYRKSDEDPLYFAEPFDKWHAWMDLIRSAAHKDREFYIRGIKVKQKRGQVVMSVKDMCERWRWSDGKVKRFVKYLIADGKITLQSSGVINRMSIINYDKYQSNDLTNDPANNPTNSLANNPANDPANNPTNKNDKNEENDFSEVDKSTSSEQVPTPPAESINFENLVKNFNNITKGIFGTVRLPLSEKRKSMIRARIREHGKENFMEAIRMSMKCPFLKGQSKNGWKMTFDWFIKPTNFEKVLSGNYLETEPQAQPTATQHNDGKMSPIQSLEKAYEIFGVKPTKTTEL